MESGNSNSTEFVPIEIGGPGPGNKSKKWLWLILGLLVLIFIGAGIYWWLAKQQAQPVQTNPVTRQNPQTPATVDDPQLKKFITPTTGETWLATPKNMSSQGWIQNEDREFYIKNGVEAAKIDETMRQNIPTYYEVGSRAGNRIVHVEVPNFVGVGNTIHLLFEKRGETAVLIAKPQSTGRYEVDPTSWLKENVLTNKVTTIDTTTTYDSLSVPDKIDLGNKESVSRQEYAAIDTQLYKSQDDVTKTKVLDLGGSKLFRTEKKYSDTGLTNIGYEIHTPIDTIIGMQYMPNTESLEKYVFDNKKPALKSDGTHDTMHAIARGCGGTSAAVTRTDVLKMADLVAIGKTDTGRTVYEPKNRTSSLSTKAFDESQSVSDKAVTQSEFWENHALMVMENAKGELLVYVRDAYGPVGGCAKPVVYLYPTTAQSVDVRVGANVTLSDPLYDPRGWRNVWAEPSGKLTYRGTIYDSLFWEGTGIGEYPSITSGTVVARANAAKTIKSQLAEQGLNDKEISDFMTYWTDRIPSKPYIRLTWLTTKQMDMLAPLYVVPRPDTVKRVFLDMDGYDQSITLPQQKLESFTRRGFTVVEWGGLVQGELR